MNGDRVVESIEPRPMEALGPFSVLDGAEAMKGLQGAGGLQSESGSIVADGPHAEAVVSSYVQEWVAGKVPRDVLIPADTAATLRRIAIWTCVTHDMMVMLLMDRLLGQPAGAHAVEYLDGLVALEGEWDPWLQSVHGPAVRVSLT